MTRTHRRQLRSQPGRPLRAPLGLPWVGACVAALLAALVAFGGPRAEAEDAAAKGRTRWILDMTHGPLRTVEVKDASGGATSYHYMTITVTNSTGLARKWNPLVKAVTDTDKTYLAAGDAAALERIRKQERKSALVPINSTAGHIQSGQTLETVAIMGPLDALYDKVHVEIYGLVDPIAIYKVEQYGDKSPKGARGEDVVIGPRSVIVDSAYYERNQAILKELRKEAGNEMLPRPAVEYTEVAEIRYWDAVYERLGDEFHCEDDVITFLREGWRVKGLPKGLRVITIEGGGS
jgi:hypothetical protein